MPRILIAFGLLLVVGGFVVPMATQFGSLKIPGLQDPTSEALCRPGERLEKSTGGSHRLLGTNSYASSVLFECVDARGARREVTGEFVSGLGGEAAGFVKNIFGTVLISTVLPMIGTLLLICGIIMAVRRGIGSGKLRVVTPVYADVTEHYKQVVAGKPASPAIRPDASAKSADCSSRLQQLESMYRSKLISEEEYQTKRNEILQQL